MIAEGLRRGRNAAYRVASPADALWRCLSDKPPLPPLWLRRHTGPVAQFESAARDTAAFLDGLSLLRTGDVVLDIGCGAGAMVEELARRFGPAGGYVGFDVHAPSIRWCRKRWAAEPRFAFELARVASAYGSRSGASPATYRFPLDDGRADFVLAKSVFTHLLPEDAGHYLAEIRRVLRPGRVAVVTAFLYDPSGLARDAASVAFPCGDRDGLVRWSRNARPTAAVAYARPFFEGLVAGAGLRLQWMSLGFFPGKERLSGQDTLVLVH